MVRGNSVETLKLHKMNITNHPTTRLINPCKKEIGRTSKHVLNKINTELLSKSSTMNEESTISVIKWFKNINNKRLYIFCGSI